MPPTPSHPVCWTLCLDPNCVQVALRQNPGEVLAAYLLFQLHAASGRAEQATSVAEAAARAAPTWAAPGVRRCVDL